LVAADKYPAHKLVWRGVTVRALPEALLDRRTFCFWRVPGAGKAKQPAYRDGSKWRFEGWKDSKNLACWQDASKIAEDEEVNVGLVVPDEWVFLDFDSCRNPKTGEVNQAVMAILERLKTSISVSSSGKGLHVPLRIPHGLPLPDTNKFSNDELLLFKDEKHGDLKKPGTFVAFDWTPLEPFNALVYKEAAMFPDWLEDELFKSAGKSAHTARAEPATGPRKVSTSRTRTPYESRG